MDIYIGYDERESRMAEMCKESIVRNCSDPDELEIEYISKDDFNKAEYFRDESNDKPSTAFSFARFLTPYKNKFSGWALFMDCDMLVLGDVSQLFKKYNNEEYSAYCVQHKEYISSVNIKMDNIKQTNVRCKNWSSFIMFNCEHKCSKSLMPRVVSTFPPEYLHQFGWISDQDWLGKIPREWNWLAGEVDYPEFTDLVNIDSKKPIENIHFTLFHPELAEDENDEKNINCPFAQLWYDWYEKVFGEMHKYYTRYLDIRDKNARGILERAEEIEEPDIW